MSVFNSFLARDVLQLRDRHGRPLGEKFVPHLLAEVETKFVPCPYAGRRATRPYPMNASALADVGRSWRDVLETLRLIREGFARKGLVKDGEYASYWRLWCAATFLPDFFAYREDAPCGDRELPVAVASVYKISIGFTVSLVGLMYDEMMERPAGPLEPEALYALVDANGDLISEDRQGVCAGPPEFVIEAAATMLGRNGAASDNGLFRSSEDYARFIDFAVSGVAMTQAMYAYTAEIVRLDFGLAQTIDDVERGRLQAARDAWAEAQASANTVFQGRYMLRRAMEMKARSGPDFARIRRGVARMTDDTLDPADVERTKAWITAVEDETDSPVSQRYLALDDAFVPRLRKLCDRLHIALACAPVGEMWGREQLGDFLGPMPRDFLSYVP
jgi:hypothetical protein